MGAMSRRKGACGEREGVALAIECGFPSAHRSAPLQAATGGSGAYGDISGIPGLYVEVKRHARVPVARLAYELLAEDRPGMTAILLSRDNGERWLATLDAREYLNAHDELLRLRSEVLFLRRALAPAVSSREVFPARTAWDDAHEPIKTFPGQCPEAAGFKP